MLKCFEKMYTAQPVILKSPSRDISQWRITALGDKIYACFSWFGPCCHLQLHLPLLASLCHPSCPQQLLVLVHLPLEVNSCQHFTYSAILFLACVPLHMLFSLLGLIFTACLQCARYYFMKLDASYVLTFINIRTILQCTTIVDPIIEN